MKPLLRLVRISATLLLCAALLLPTHPCSADIYKWKDDTGHWHFSDSPPSETSLQREPDGGAPPADGAAPPADRSPKQSGAADAAHAATAQGGLLWRISGQGVRPSHLLGTIHSSDPRVVRLKADVIQALDQSDRFVMEMKMDSSALMGMGAKMMLTDGRDLESLIGSPLYQKAVEAMAGYGLPEMAVRNLKPWAVMALLSMPKPTPEPILDLALLKRAGEAGKPTDGLETADEQLAVFDGLAMADQIALLKMTLAQLPDLPEMFEQLIRAYADDDLQRLAALASRYREDADMAAANRFMLRLNDERNQRMIQRMVPYLKQGNSFIAVGALHLPGPQGLIALLRRQGYQVTPVR